MGSKETGDRDLSIEDVGKIEKFFNRNSDDFLSPVSIILTNGGYR